MYYCSYTVCPVRSYESCSLPYYAMDCFLRFFAYHAVWVGITTFSTFNSLFVPLFYTCTFDLYVTKVETSPASLVCHLFPPPVHKRTYFHPLYRHKLKCNILKGNDSCLWPIVSLQQHFPHLPLKPGYSKLSFQCPANFLFRVILSIVFG